MKKIFALTTTILLSMVALGQPGGNLGQLELKVTEKYKATVGEADKITARPQFEDTTTIKLPVNYRISGRPVEVQYKMEPISPARIAKIPVEELRQGLLKAGYGFYNTPLLEGYWNSGRSSKQSYGFWGQHQSTQTGVEETIFEDNGMSINSLGGFYNRFYRNMKWETELSGNWEKYSYYGIDSYADSSFLPVPDEEEKPEPMYNWFRKYQLKTALSGDDQKDLGVLDKIGLRYYNLSDRFGAAENRFDISTNWQIPADDLAIDLDFNLGYFQTSFDSLPLANQSQNYVGASAIAPLGKQSYLTTQIKPTVQTSFSGVLFELGVNVYGYQRSGDSIDGNFKPAFFPLASLEYAVVKDVLTAYAGVKGQLRHNTFDNQVDDNPFIFPRYEIIPTRTTDAFVGMSGIVSSTTSFNLSGGFQFVRDLPIYYRNPFYNRDSLLGPPALDIFYENVGIFYIAGELSMNVNDNLQLGLNGRLQQFSLDGLEEAYHRPNFTASLNADYTLREKLKIGTDLNFVGNRPAFDEALEKLTGNSADLPAYLDWDLELEYLYNSRLSAFISANNLLNQQYDLYLGYKAQSINVMLGFAYRF